MLGALRKVSLAPERSNPCRAFPVSGVRYERDHPRQHVPELWAQRDGRRMGGDCHERVHSAALFGQGPQGPQMVNQTTYFPMVADQMWCGHWRSTLIHAAVPGSAT